eukprot:TRINITY_DN8906_c0_g1_i1.p1 TRINITY_DN8906_c0_g1~~TRINITY_DN8906_c0_g1_i1.p1  ORF type:complete len:175 (-),score=27.25 TRINITY_DN8906_c0_g1_i1:49-573(-)
MSFPLVVDTETISKGRRILEEMIPDHTSAVYFICDTEEGCVWYVGCTDDFSTEIEKLWKKFVLQADGKYSIWREAMINLNFSLDQFRVIRMDSKYPSILHKVLNTRFQFPLNKDSQGHLYGEPDMMVSDLLFVDADVAKSPISQSSMRLLDKQVVDSVETLLIAVDQCTGLSRH